MTTDTTLNTEISLKNVRVSFPHIFEPKAFPGSPVAKFSCTFLLDKTIHKDLIIKVAALIKEVALSNFKDKKLPMADKLCLRDGDLTGREENVGCWVLTASEAKRPIVVDQSRTPLVKEDEVIYPGCRVNAKVRLWAQDNQYGRRINANLIGVQFAGDAERFAGGRPNYSADDVFDDISDFEAGSNENENDPFA